MMMQDQIGNANGMHMGNGNYSYRSGTTARSMKPNMHLVQHLGQQAEFQEANIGASLSLSPLLNPLLPFVT